MEKVVKTLEISTFAKKCCSHAGREGPPRHRVREKAYIVFVNVDISNVLATFFLQNQVLLIKPMPKQLFRSNIENM